MTARLLKPCSSLRSLCAGHTGNPICPDCGIVPAWGGHLWADGPPKR